MPTQTRRFPYAITAAAIVAALIVGAIGGRILAQVPADWGTTWAAIAAIATVLATGAAAVAGFFAWKTLHHEIDVTQEERAEREWRNAESYERENRRLLSIATGVEIRGLSNVDTVSDDDDASLNGRSFQRMKITNNTGQPIYQVEIDHSGLEPDPILLAGGSTEFRLVGPASLRTDGWNQHDDFLLWKAENVAVRFVLDGARIRVPFVESTVPEIEEWSPCPAMKPDDSVEFTAWEKSQRQLDAADS